MVHLVFMNTFQKDSKNFGGLVRIATAINPG
jgi:hypothetical protein